MSLMTIPTRPMGTGSVIPMSLSEGWLSSLFINWFIHNLLKLIITWSTLSNVLIRGMMYCVEACERSATDAGFSVGVLIMLVSLMLRLTFSAAALTGRKMQPNNGTTLPLSLRSCLSTAFNSKTSFKEPFLSICTRLGAEEKPRSRRNSITSRHSSHSCLDA